MDKTKLRQLCAKVFQGDKLDKALFLIEDHNMYTISRMSEEMLEEAQAEVLVSVYKDECDFVLFDHYRNCKNFDDAVTTFMEVKV